MKEIFVDIDDTICITDGLDYENSIPIFSRIEFINKLYNKGHIITYWTSRGVKSGIDYKELTEKQLKNWSCKFHNLKLDKPSYDIFIDDKSINSPIFFENDYTTKDYLKSLL